MSSFVYGAVTRKREEAPKDASTTTSPPGVRTYVDTLTAIVPAEVLVLHAFMVEQATTTSKVNGKAVTTIEDAAALEATFWVCILLSMLVFVMGRLAAKKGRWERSDWIRMGIPPVAFVLWTILQKSTAWDAVSPDSISEAGRALIGATGAIVLGSLAAALGAKLDRGGAAPAG
jgi:hypothetical protein